MKLLQSFQIFLKTLYFIFQLIFWPSKTNGPKVFIKLEDPRCGKYMYILIMHFLMENHTVFVYPNLKFISSLLPYKKLLFRFPAIKISLLPTTKITCSITSSKITIGKHEKIFSLSYHYFAPQQHSIIVPYPMSPQHYYPNTAQVLKELRGSKKTIGVFFSGNQNPELYNKSIISEKFGKVTRLKLLDFLQKSMPINKFQVVERNGELAGNNLDKFLLVKWEWSPSYHMNKEARIDDTNWLTCLSTCNFFLACPGMTMPMCHNIIEAMAVGCIPITQYAEEFYPQLKDGINCLTFKDKEDAMQKILYALELSPEKIETMRLAVISYYENFLSSSSFIKSIEDYRNAKGLITMNAEQLSI